MERSRALPARRWGTALLAGGLAVLVLLLLPRSNGVPVESPDSVDVAALAARSAARLGFTPVVPRGLGAGWTPRGASVQRGTDGRPTWHLTYLTPSGEVAGVQQADHATPAWEGRQVTDGREQGTRLIGGVTWVVRSRTDRGVVSLVRRPAGGSTLTAVVSGSGGDAEVQALAAAVS